jgi:hypothetical protein
MIREQEKEKLFQAATVHSSFDSNDLCSYSMYNGHQFELHLELIEELVQEKKLLKFHYNPDEDEYYKYNELVRLTECITVYRRNLFYGEDPMTDEEFIDSLLDIKEL